MLAGIQTFGELVHDPCHEHLVRYYGWYSHRQRGIRAKLRKVEEPESEQVRIDRSALDAEKSASGRPRAGSLSTWAMWIKQVYEIDPLECPVRRRDEDHPCYRASPTGRHRAGLASLRPVGRADPHACQCTCSAGSIGGRPARAS